MICYLLLQGLSFEHCDEYDKHFYSRTNVQFCIVVNTRHSSVAGHRMLFSMMTEATMPNFVI